MSTCSRGLRPTVYDAKLHELVGPYDVNRKLLAMVLAPASSSRGLAFPRDEKDA